MVTPFRSEIYKKVLQFFLPSHFDSKTSIDVFRAYVNAGEKCLNLGCTFILVYIIAISTIIEPVYITVECFSFDVLVLNVIKFIHLTLHSINTRLTPIV